MTTASDLMADFVERSGVTGRAPSRRYLWTDAFAVCNLLELGRIDVARALIARVHRELGRYRNDDSIHLRTPSTGVLRTPVTLGNPRRPLEVPEGGRGAEPGLSPHGWISGLSEAEGQAHPTLGGLRIGKPLPERRPGERFDERLEWDRDGQYFHYLTKWMHALDQTARATDDSHLAQYARELAAAAHQRFVYGPPTARRMYWKMSVDLMRPQVASMGHHDPLDGYVTCVQLRSTSDHGPDLDRAIDEFHAMVEPGTLATADPLGIGGLLFDAYRLHQLDRDRPLREAILAAAHRGLTHFIEQQQLAQPPDHRVAFRELGLAIGISALERMMPHRLESFLGVRDMIIAFWTDPSHRNSPMYLDHHDINDVMLATSLAPSGFLVLGPTLHSRHEPCSSLGT